MIPGVRFASRGRGQQRYRSDLNMGYYIFMGIGIIVLFSVLFVLKKKGG